MKISRSICVIFLMFMSLLSGAQEIHFFSEGTDNNFYDQGIVNVNGLNGSTFEHTYPPGGSPTKWNDKVPCSTTAYKGETSLKFNYTSAENGNWQVRIHRNDWSATDISNMDSISFFIFSETELPKTALPLIGIMTNNGTSDLDTLSKYNENIPASTWIQIKYPIDSLKGTFDLTQAKAIILAQSENDNSSRLVLIDEILAFKNLDEIPAVEVFSATGYDSHAELNWVHPMADLNYKIYASFDGGQTFELRAETTEDFYLDFVPENGRNSTVNYRIIASAQSKDSEPNEKSVEIRDFTDEELMDMVQEYSFRYFWEGAHQATGMSVERSNGNGLTVASGATGMGLMGMIVAYEREYRPREELKDRILSILDFLGTCERHHGAWSHWYNADTKASQKFGDKDDGGDIVETSYVAAAMIALKNYFDGTDGKSVQIRQKADQLWKEIDWRWYQNGQNVLFWHWSPNSNFEKNLKVSGWNESLVTYIMAASSPTHGIEKVVYDQGWARNGNMVNKRTYYDLEINLARDWGGPMFWIHYSYLGINPHGLEDQYADYWQEYVNIAKIHHAYAIDNPFNFENYSDKCWGLTASDGPDGYNAHKPMTNDDGTVSPTAALASMPYTPEESIKALKYFYRERGQDLFGKYGPYDAFNDTRDWVKESYIGIDQGPIVVMIENHRTALLWNEVMKDADVKAGLDKLGFQYQVVTSSEKLKRESKFKIYPNPATNKIYFSGSGLDMTEPIQLKILSLDGRIIKLAKIDQPGNDFSVDCSGIKPGLYFIRLESENKVWSQKLIIQK